MSLADDPKRLRFFLFENAMWLVSSGARLIEMLAATESWHRPFLSPKMHHAQLDFTEYHSSACIFQIFFPHQQMKQDAT